MLTDEGDGLTAGYTVEYSETGQSGARPTAAAAAGDLYSLILGSPPCLAQRVSRVVWVGAGSRKSGQRSHRVSQLVWAGGWLSRYRPNSGRSVSSGSGRRSLRPRTSRPDGRYNTPNVVASHVSAMGLMF